MDSLNEPLFSENRLDGHIAKVRMHLPNARVLIVDDNHTNLDSVKGMLKPYGIKTDCVDSGRKAIAAVDAGNFIYNAIFMDYIMPDMDGIETTQAIRNIGTDYAIDVPIIALTADEDTDNEEMFLTNGFQAFLTKPIDIQRLDDIIMRWVRSEEMDDVSAHLNEAGSLGSSGVSRLKGMSIKGLDIDKGIKRFGGDEDAYLDVLRSYTANTRILLSSIDNAGDDISPEYVIIVHGIKGSSRSIFADAVANAAANLESACRKGDFEYVSSHNYELIENTRSLISELEDMLAELSSDIKKQTKDKPDARTLSSLLEACEAFNMEGVYVAMNELEKFEYTHNNELILWLRINADLMNYTEIVSKLRRLNDA